MIDDHQGRGREPDDGELLDRILGVDQPASEAAFQAVLLRHGPMVLGVCRQVLGRAHDAEDAFQATFLILFRRAGSIRDKKALRSWLYEVAFRTALRARTRAARHRACEKEAAAMSAGLQRLDPERDDLAPVLHEEIHRLPASYRAAVVLCYLEGRTNEEAAALLRCPVGTVKGRLSRAREVLRDRLTRRGLALTAALLMARLPHHRSAAEPVPPVLAEATVRGVLAVARGGLPEAAGVSAHVLELVEAELARRSRLVVLTTGPALRWLLAAAAVLAVLSVALGPRAETAQRLVADLLAAATGGGGPGGCPHDH
jgi:RNA polymerase sigma factor (sigma-70 family)